MAKYNKLLDQCKAMDRSNLAKPAKPRLVVRVKVKIRTLNDQGEERWHDTEGFLRR